MDFQNRNFKLLDYSPTHNQFLFRASKNSQFKENLDILIEGTFFLSIPLSFKDCSIQLASASEKKQFKSIAQINNFNPKQNVFVLGMGGKNFFIGAYKISFQKNLLEGMETSIPSKKEGILEEKAILELVKKAKKEPINKLMEKIHFSNWIKIED